MTQQYLSGELSYLLGQLEATLTTEAWRTETAHLRKRAETGARGALISVPALALEVANHECWESLTRGDAAAFVHQAEATAQLWEFSVCAGLVQEREGTTLP